MCVGRRLHHAARRHTLQSRSQDCCRLIAGSSGLKAKVEGSSQKPMDNNRCPLRSKEGYGPFQTLAIERWLQGQTCNDKSFVVSKNLLGVALFFRFEWLFFLLRT